MTRPSPLVPARRLEEQELPCCLARPMESPDCAALWFSLNGDMRGVVRGFLDVPSLAMLRATCHGELMSIPIQNSYLVTKESVEKGYISIVRHLVSRLSKQEQGYLSEAMLVLAAQCGHVEIVDYFDEIGLKPRRRYRMAHAAVRGGNVALVIRYFKRSDHWAPELSIAAAHYGSFDVIKYLWDIDPTLVRDNVYQIFEGNNMKILEFLLEKKGTELLSERGCEFIAIKNGNVAMLKLLLEHGHKISIRNTPSAGKSESIEMIDFLEREVAWDMRGNSGLLVGAAARGNESFLFYLKERFQAPLCDFVFYKACRSGNLALVQRLVVLECPYSITAAFNFAVKSGNANLLDYLHSKHTELQSLDGSSMVCLAALRNEEDAFMYLLTKFRLNTYDLNLCIKHAVQCGSVALLEPLHDRYPCQDEQKLLVKAASHGNLLCVKFYIARGCSWTQAVARAALSRGYLHVLKYALDQGCPWNAKRVKAPRGYPAIREFIGSLQKNERR